MLRNKHFQAFTKVRSQEVNLRHEFGMKINSSAILSRFHFHDFANNQILMKEKSKNNNFPSPYFFSFAEAMRLISDIKNDHFEPINFIQVSCVGHNDWTE